MVDVMIKPIIHSFKNRIIAIVDVKNSMFNLETNRILGVFFSGFYGFSIAIYAINFIHRYGSLDKLNSLSSLANYSIVVWCMVPVFCCLIWSATMYLLFMEDPEFTELIRREVLEQYDLRMEDVTYAGPYIFKFDRNGNESIELESVCGMLVLGSIVTTFLSMVLYYGIKCYNMIKNNFHTSSCFTQHSNVTRMLQRELFHALVVQTLVPVLFVYIPVSIVLFCTVFLIDIGNASGTLCITIALYPVIDSLPTLLIVRHYRKVVRGMLCRTKQQKTMIEGSAMKTVTSNLQNIPH